MTDTLTDTITTPCIVDAMPEDVYHGDPIPGGSLSSGGARTLLKPAGPARFAYERQHPRPPKKAYDIGHATHTMLLGTGLDIVEIEYDNYRKLQAQADRDDAYAAGKTPLLTKELAEVEAMAAAVRRHELAGPLLAADGPAEQSYFWTDADTGVCRRARTDKVIRDRAGRAVVVDLKTCEAADARAAARSAANYGYYQQDPWYRDALVALDVDDDPGFIFVFVEKEPPHLVHVVQLSPDDVAAGRARNRRALELYARCVADGAWPGHPTGITEIDLPAWAREEW